MSWRYRCRVRCWYLRRCWDVDKDGRSSGVLCDKEPVALCRLLATALLIIVDPDLLPFSHNKSPPTACRTMPQSIITAPSTALLSHHPPCTSPLPLLCGCAPSPTSNTACEWSSWLLTGLCGIWKNLLAILDHYSARDISGGLPICRWGGISCPVLESKRTRSFPVRRCGRFDSGPSSTHTRLFSIPTTNHSVYLICLAGSSGRSHSLFFLITLYSFLSFSW
jgi:hypothetical protein